MAKAGYSVTTGAAVALVAATAKTVLFAVAPAQFGMDLKKYRLAFDGVTASAVPVLVELCALSAASNSVAGTGNTTATVNQVYGRAITAGFTGGYNASAEPTVLTPIDSFLVTPTGGTVLFDFPLGDTPDNDVSKGFALRLTAPAPVNARATLWFERC
jgi:hypothetical protein